MTDKKANLVKFVLLLLPLCFMNIPSTFALNNAEINAFRSRPWIEENSGKQGFVNITLQSLLILEIRSNGIPDHKTGAVAKNISEQVYSYAFARTPEKISFSKCLPQGIIGFAVNGIPIYNSYTPQCCDSAKSLDMFDKCWGKVDSSGRYHYTSPPMCLFKPICNSSSPLLGVAVDGFPIYGPYDENGQLLTSADLDECHGRFSNNNYRYHVTFDFPYVIGCFAGVPSPAFIPQDCTCRTKADPCPSPGSNQTTFLAPPLPPPDPSRKKRSTSESASSYISSLATKSCCQAAADCGYIYNPNKSGYNLPTSALIVFLILVQFLALTA